MLKRVAVSIAILALAGVSLAQSNVTKPVKKDQPSKTPAPKKPSTTNKKSGALKVGDTAPELSIDSWVKGKPVKGFEEGRVYVVEFWATWCPPCEANIPHLTELQKKYKDATIIGVAASERAASNGADRRLNDLQRYVKAKGQKMDYTVGYAGGREMYDAWMKAAGRTTIPSAFVVDGEGKIAWMGNPSDKAFEQQISKSVKSASQKKSVEKKVEKRDEKRDQKQDKQQDSQRQEKRDQQSQKDEQSQKEEKSQKNQKSKKSTDSSKKNDSSKKEEKNKDEKK